MGQPAMDQRMQMNPQMMQQMGRPMMGNMPGMPMGQQMMMNPATQYYLSRSIPIIPMVTPQNPNYKLTVGEIIFEFVEKIAGEDKAPKITGMLIDLPIEEIRQYLQHFEKLEDKVKEACILLSNQEGN